MKGILKEGKTGTGDKLVIKWDKSVKNHFRILEEF